MSRYYYYEIYNDINNKIYIGITENFKRREKEHLSMLRNYNHVNYKLQNDYNKGIKLKIKILEEKNFSSSEEAYLYEKELIDRYDCVNNGYNIALGGHLNPMYSKEIRDKMIKTKQSQVPNIIQLEEKSENQFIIVHKWNSLKEISRNKYDFRDVQTAIKKKGSYHNYYWVKEEDLNNWKPLRKVMNPIAELDNNSNIIGVEISPRIIEKDNNWAVSSIANAIKRNGKTHERKFIYITEEEYYRYKPIKITCID